MITEMEQNKETEQENGVNTPDSDFITEKIKQRPIDKKKLLRRTMITAAMAVIFALVACLTFLILEPVLSNWLYPEEEPAPIELPAETEEMLPEDMIVDDSEMVQEEEPAEVKLQDEQIAQVLDNISLDVDDYLAMYNGLAAAAREAAKSVVTVTGSVSNLDWFNDPYESKDQTSGIIVADQGKEIFILVNYENLEDAETIMVTFGSGEQVQAQLKLRDSNTKLAVISVAESDVNKETLEGIVLADLTGSSSNSAIVGKPVIAVGSPLGTSDSVCYGIVTSNNTTLNMIDSYYKVITTDIYGSGDASGVLVNLSGQVLGIIDNTHNSEDMKNLVSAIGITELRRKIEKMSNEKEQAYLGTYGTDVTIDANERLGVPYGAYITEIELDSPAMAAGIQSGDIITAIGEKEIKTYGDLVGAMIELQPNESVGITLMRQGPEEYMQMEVDVTLGKLE
ncbi:S1C family serine protease [Kineothrix sedimenti]|uniref:Trypsin-like peptidase domain-containing protein n=1 Tax=Kineothrix sedimenti TaxID=3123317 RepID=A0ABZ3EUE5_9FIRM